MPDTDPKSVATRYLASWPARDFDTTRSLLHDDMTFAGPLGTANGADEALEGLRGLSQIVKAAEPRQVIAEGDDVCVIYDLITDTDAGAVTTAGWFHIVDGKIQSLRVYFDPRPLLR